MVTDQRPHSIEMRNITKTFGRAKALKDVSFELRKGEVHALMGENGAGKSTLMKILQGAYHADAGEILVDGTPVQIASPSDAMKAGIGMVFQEFSLIPTLTVAQNVFLTHEHLGRLGLVDDREAERRAAAVFAEMDVEVDPGAEVSRLSTAYWQLTEIAKALAQEAGVLIMDEPTASLAKSEAEALFALIGRLKASGISIIYISHRMDEIYRIADRITVLRDGRHVLTDDLAALTPTQVIAAIVGRSIDTRLEERETQQHEGAPILQVKNLWSGSRVRDVSFTLHRGEILGLAGLMGSGRTELARVLFGVDRLDSGTIEIDDVPVTISHPSEAIEHGLALVPEDRRLQGLAMTHSVEANLMLPLLDEVRTAGFLSVRRLAARARELIRRFAVQVTNPSTTVSRLSGGNQQKVVIGKWIGTDPRVLVMDEPTAGVDIGTKTEIMRELRALADEGKGVVFISSELPELLAVSDRILVLRNGEVVTSLARAEIANEEALQLAIQGA
jgi:ribose transport system ATP-binding protein